MSRYLILVILNAPFILAGIINTLVNYKLGKSSKVKFAIQLFFWLLVLGGLILAEPIYLFLFSNKLTDTEPLSLFDVMQITGIIALFFAISRSRTKIEALETRVKDLHQELSIQLSKDNTIQKKSD